MTRYIRNIANSLRDRYNLLPSIYGRGFGVSLLLTLSLISCKEENSNHADLAASPAKRRTPTMLTLRQRLQRYITSSC